MTFIKRADLGRPLTWDELDSNFEQVDSYAAAASASASAAQTQAQSSSQSAQQALQYQQAAETAAASAEGAVDDFKDELSSSGVPIVDDSRVFVQQPFVGAIVRSQHDKNAENITPTDFGAIGDGVANDSTKFSALEAVISGLDINLLGKAYFVDSIPSANRYYNGSWVLPSGPSRTRWQGAQLTGAGRIAFGDGALSALPDVYSMGQGAAVLAIGYRVLASATQVKKSIALGANAMEHTVISRDNIAIGEASLRNIQSRSPDYSQAQRQGTRNVAIGGNAGYFSVDSQGMVIVGRNAGHCVEAGTGLVAIGNGAVGGSAPIGLSGEIENGAPWGVDGTLIRTTGVGYDALAGNLANNNTAVGGEALANNKKSDNNSAFGARALYSLDIGTGSNGGTNVTKNIDGTYSHLANVLTLNFTAHGAAVGDIVQIRLLDGGSQTFASDIAYAKVVTVINADSFTVSHPISRTASGTAHLYGLETAIQLPRNERNTAVGASAGSLITTGTLITLSGYSAAGVATYGNRATVIGGLAASNGATSVDTSVVVGSFGAYNMTTLTKVTALGDSALRNKTDGTALTDAWANITGVGFDSRVSGPNQLQLGDSFTNVYSQTAVQVRSDERDKTDKREIDGDLAVAFVRGLKSYLYKYDFRDDYFEEVDGELKAIPKDGSKKRERDHAGWLSQQVKALMDSLGIDFGMYQDHLINGGCDVKTLAYEQSLPFITKAMDVAFERLDEQNLIIAEQAKTITTLEERLANIEEILSRMNK